MLKRSLALLRDIKKRFSHYRPLVEVIIFADRLRKNLKTYQIAYPGLLFAPVLKSNAYGHGLREVAKVLDKEAVPFFVVDSLYEAMLLRREEIQSEILVIGFTPLENIRASRARKITFTISSIEQLEELAAMRMSLTIHLKIDTGMHRQGILPGDMDRAIRILKTTKALRLEGVCSHFADADGGKATFTNTQIGAWNNAVRIFRNNFPAIKFFHIANSAGAFYSGKIDANVARLGIGLYGIDPSPFTKLPLEPALELRSIVSSVKTIPAGSRVGYNVTYRTIKPMVVATVPAGYFEGVDRRLSNKGVFKIGDNYCPIAGRVSMNITSIDATKIPGVKTGDTVTLISSSAGDKNSAKGIAKITGAIPWEILVHIPQHLRRTVIGNPSQ